MQRCSSSGHCCNSRAAPFRNTGGKRRARIPCPTLHVVSGIHCSGAAFCLITDEPHFLGVLQLVSCLLLYKSVQAGSPNAAAGSCRTQSGWQVCTLDIPTVDVIAGSWRFRLVLSTTSASTIVNVPRPALADTEADRGVQHLVNGTNSARTAPGTLRRNCRRLRDQPAVREC